MRPPALITLLATFLLSGGSGGAAPAKALLPVKSTLLRDDPLLQQKVTLEATDRPLGDVLKELSPTLKADLTVSPGIADQRVTLHLTDQPVYLLMNRLPQLLSHLPEHPHGYYWEKLDRSAKQRPAFNLWRDLRSVQDEERELDYPRREAGVLLRDLRNMAQLPPKERAAYKGDYRYPLNPEDAKDVALGKALKGLTDEQLEALLDGQNLTLDSAAFAEELAASKKRQQDEWKHRQDLDKMIYGEDRSFPNGFPAQPDLAPVLSITRADRDGEYPDDATRYYISLSYFTHQGSLDVLAILDPYNTVQMRGPWLIGPFVPAKSTPPPLIDLTPLLSEKVATPAQRSDLGFTLQALAKAGHLTVYHEAFLKPSTPFTGLAERLPTLKGTLSQIIEAVCAEWNCRSQKVGGDYLFWSRTWAQDRAADIPDAFLRKWRARLQKQQGIFHWQDHAEIAGALTWPQMGLTLRAAFPAGCCQDAQSFKMWHLLGTLDASEREATFSASGMPLKALSPVSQEALASGFRPQLAQVTGGQLDDAVLTFQVKPGDPAVYSLPNEQVSMDVKADDQKLFGASDLVWLPASPALQAAPAHP